MSLQRQVGEAHDGGFWYAVEAEVDAREGVLRPMVPKSEYCAWYAEISGTVYAAVRSPNMTAKIPSVGVSVQEVLSAAGREGKPMGRIRGK